MHKMCARLYHFRPYMQSHSDTTDQIRGTAQVAFAQDALRGIVLLNGGAIIALLTFFGQAWSKNENQGAMVISALKTGLLLYIFGALAGILAQGLAYLAQQNFVDGNRRLALNLRRTCIAVALSGMYFFGHGSIASVSQFITR